MREIERRASRLLVLSPAGRILLLHVAPSFRSPFWVTPGGGLDDGETLEQAALRELREEVGRDDLPLGPLLWTRTVDFTWEEWLVRQEESTFLVEVDHEFDAITTHPDGEPIVGSRWFDVESIRALRESVFPEDLADLLSALRRGGPATSG